MNVTKVKYLSEKVKVDFDQPNGSSFVRCSMECGDEPEKRFVDALDAVQEQVRGHVGKKALAEHVEVTGVSVDTDKHGRRGFVFTVKVSTALGEMHTALPRMIERKETEKGPNVLSDICLAKVEKFIEEAVRYVSGKRKQEGLFDADGVTAAEAQG